MRGAAEVFRDNRPSESQARHACQYEDDDNKPRPPVDSAHSAVKVAIAAQAKER